jgi:hypothetical protein
MSLVKQRRPDLGRVTVASSGALESAAVIGDTMRTGIAAMTGRYRTTHDLLIEGFASAIASGAPPPVGAEEGREAVRVMNLISRQLEDAEPR